MKQTSILLVLVLLFTNAISTNAQSWKNFHIISGNPNNTGNEIKYITASTGAVGATIVTTNGVPAANTQLPYGVAFDPTEGKLYYSKPDQVTATNSVFNVYNNTVAVPTHTNLATITAGQFFRMGVGQDGNVYGTVVSLVSAVRASNPRIDIQTVKLTRYNPTTATFTVLGNIQCPAAYASTMPAPYNDGNYWSSSNATAAQAVTFGAYTFALGHCGYGDLVIAPNNTLYITIGKKLMTIPNYTSLTGTTLIPSVEVGDCMPSGIGFGFGGATSQGPGTYGISWDYASDNLFLISSRTSDGRDGSYLLNPTTLALVGSFNLAPVAASNFADLTEILSSVGAAKQLTNVQWLGYNNRYRLTYRIRTENIGGSVLKNVQIAENLQTAFPALTISNVSTSFINNPAGLVLNGAYNGTSTTNLLDGTKALYGVLYNGADLNGGAGTITAGSNYAIIQVVFDVAGVSTNGVTTYNNTAVASGNSFDGTSVTDNSDNGTAVETGTVNYKADDAGEGDATPIKFGSTVSGTVWNDANGSANNTFANIFTAGESGTNATGLNAVLIDPVTNLVIASVPVDANGTYSFSNVPSFANLQVRLSTTAGMAGSAPPAASLPPGWTNTSPLSTNTTGDINTGTYNAADASRFGAIDDPNNDFGIERTPTSPDQSYTISQPLLNAFTTLNGTGALNSPAPLSGTDPEDGALGSGNTFNVVSVAGLNGNKLFYNGIEITGPISIPNYNPALLQVQYTNPGTTSLSFTYQSVDAAGKGSNIASYTINWLIPLPLNNLEITATLNGTTVVINWLTENELNVAKFIVERSTDNNTFTAVAEKPGNGNSSGVNNLYKANDDITAVITNSVIYYRIRVIDNDGKFVISKTVVVRIGAVDAIKIWPNPVFDNVSISVYSKVATNLNVRIMDITGKIITLNNFSIVKGNNQVNVSDLSKIANGSYIMQVTDKTGSIQIIQKIIKE